MDGDTIACLIVATVGLILFAGLIIAIVHLTYGKGGYAYRRFGVQFEKDRPKNLVKVVTLEATAIIVIYIIVALIIGTYEGIGLAIIYVVMPLVLLTTIADYIVFSHIAKRNMRQREERERLSYYQTPEDKKTKDTELFKDENKNGECRGE